MPVDLYVSVNSRRCMSGIANFTFVWTQLSGPTIPTTVNMHVSHLHIAANSLTSGHDYCFNFTATMLSDGDEYYGSDATCVSVQPAPIVAKIQGGSEFHQYANAPFTLDASSSYDPDNPTEALTFAWNVSCKTSSCDGGIKTDTITNNASLRITAASSSPGCICEYVCTVNNRGRSSSAKINVLFVDNPVLTTSIVILSKHSTTPQGVMITSDRRLKLSAVIAKSEGTEAAAIAYYNWNITGLQHTNAFASAKNSSVIVIKEDMFEPGSWIVVSLTVNRGVFYGKASILIGTYAVPTSSQGHTASCGANPRSGVVGLTQFEFWCSGWGDGQGLQASTLTYQFELMSWDGFNTDGTESGSNATRSELMYRPFTPNHKIEGILPPLGDPKCNYSLIIRATVKSLHGAMTTRDFLIQVNRSTNPMNDIEASFMMSDTVKTAALHGDLPTTTSEIVNIMSLVRNHEIVNNSMTESDMGLSLVRDSLSSLTTLHTNTPNTSMNAQCITQTLAYIVETSSLSLGRIDPPTALESLQLAQRVMSQIASDEFADMVQKTVISNSVLQAAEGVLTKGEHGVEGLDTFSEIVDTMLAAVAKELVPGESPFVVAKGSMQVEISKYELGMIGNASLNLKNERVPNLLSSSDVEISIPSKVLQAWFPTGNFEIVLVSSSSDYLTLAGERSGFNTDPSNAAEARNASTVSGVVQISAYQDGAPRSFSIPEFLSERITFTQPLVTSIAAEEDRTFECEVWNDVSYNWTMGMCMTSTSPQGVVVSGNAEGARPLNFLASTGETSAMLVSETDQTGSFRVRYAQTNAVPNDESLDFINALTSSYIPFLMILLSGGLSLILLPYVRQRDKEIASKLQPASNSMIFKKKSKEDNGLDLSHMQITFKDDGMANSPTHKRKSILSPLSAFSSSSKKIHPIPITEEDSSGAKVEEKAEEAPGSGGWLRNLLPSSTHNGGTKKGWIDEKDDLTATNVASAKPDKTEKKTKNAVGSWVVAPMDNDDSNDMPARSITQKDGKEKRRKAFHFPISGGREDDGDHLASKDSDVNKVSPNVNSAENVLFFPKPDPSRRKRGRGKHSE
eukprot:jgi/Bigna1/137086/aug1.37_g11794